MASREEGDKAPATRGGVLLQKRMVSIDHNFCVTQSREDSPYQPSCFAPALHFLFHWSATLSVCCFLLNHLSSSWKSTRTLSGAAGFGPVAFPDTALLPTPNNPPEAEQPFNLVELKGSRRAVNIYEENQQERFYVRC